jgi:hypothetical protein
MVFGKTFRQAFEFYKPDFFDLRRHGCRRSSKISDFMPLIVPAVLRRFCRPKEQCVALQGGKNVP